MPMVRDIWTGRFVGGICEDHQGLHFMIALDQADGREVMVRVPTHRIEAFIKGAQREQDKVAARQLGDTQNAVEKRGKP